MMSGNLNAERFPFACVVMLLVRLSFVAAGPMEILLLITTSLEEFCSIQQGVYTPVSRLIFSTISFTFIGDGSTKTNTFSLLEFPLGMQNLLNISVSTTLTGSPSLPIPQILKCLPTLRRFSFLGRQRGK